MYLLGYDIGSSSVKACLVEVESGKSVASAFYPKTEAEIIAVQPGWAEQDPEIWWHNLKLATQDVFAGSGVDPSSVKAIGISYQMHGLVCVNKEKQVLRPAIIWCDSRAVSYGERAFQTLGETYCMEHLLNSPGNFTASKLAWVKENEPAIYEQIYKILLPGDYIAMKLSGEIHTTISALSEAMLWDFKEKCLANFLLEYYGFDTSMIPDVCPTFAEQGRVTASVAKELGLVEGIPITYRAGDQPNNALSLGVLNPGKIAATAGTSGVVYGIHEKIAYDPLSRVNNFAHVNHTNEQTRLGVLLCVNGTGILNSWIKRTVAVPNTSYTEMNALAQHIPIGSEGLRVFPFGNGAERMLQNKKPNCSIQGLDFNTHTRNHLFRASQEGIVFSFKYGMEMMEKMGVSAKKIHAGYANMFQSPLFREALANVTGANIELFDTDGAMGAAKGAGIGAGVYKDFQEAFSTLEKLQTVEPDPILAKAYLEAYGSWKEQLNEMLRNN